jgi:preprotein translocase subunit SecD
MLVRSLQSVVTNTTHATSSSAGKTTEAYELSIEIKMFPPDAKRFADLTRENVGRRLLLMLGNTPLIAPVIRMPIETGNLDLTLGERKDVDRIKNDLKSLVPHE